MSYDNSTFKVGDIVALRSGSPHLTVNALVGDQSVACTYFNTTSGLFVNQTFFAQMLRGGTTMPQNPEGITR